MAQWKVRCSHSKMVPVGHLKPHPKNPNDHPDDQIPRLAQILEYQGWRYPIKVSNLSGFITSGHGRLQAAIHSGQTEVPVDFQDYESHESEFADLVADNAIADWARLDLASINVQVPELGPDFDIDLLGIKDFTLDLSEKHEGDPDETPEPPKEAKTKRGELWLLGPHRVLCGDATDKADISRLMDGEKADLCFTSPPYSDQRDYKGGIDLSTKHLSKFLCAAPCDLFAVNLGLKRSENEVVPYWDDYICTAKENGLKLLSWNVWDRSGFGYTVGQATAMFTIDHEWIFVFGKDRKDLNKTVENKQAGLAKKGTIRQRDGETTPVFTETHSKRQLGTVVRMDVARYAGGDHTHPAMFPVELPETYIAACTKPGNSVFDPFTGSGSTLIACEKTNRRCFGMEIEPLYIDVILTRWAKFTGKDPVREDGVKWSVLNSLGN